ncbi:MAG: histidine kinase [Streptosporangiaceae bacterium]
MTVQPRLPRETVIVTFVVALSTVATLALFIPGIFAAATDSAWKFVVGTMGSLLIVAFQGRVLWESAHRQINARSRVFLAVVVVVAFLLPLLENPWNSGMAAVAGMSAVSLREQYSAPLVVLAGLAATGMSLFTGWDRFQSILLGLGFPMYALSAYATVWLCLAVKELRDARAELASQAVGQERLRFARDLHDVLGHSLQAVALRAELAERLLVKDPDRVASELTEIQNIARGAVQEVRDVVRGYRVTSLRTELDGATAVLRAAGISCDAPVLPPGLPQHVHETLGWVAREAVTNVLRHSQAQWCEVTVRLEAGRAWLEIVNDGAGRPGAAGGSGLTGLGERLDAVGGEFRAGPGQDGTFQIVAAVPLLTEGAR